MKTSLSSRLKTIIDLGDKAYNGEVENRYHRAVVRSKLTWSRIIADCISDCHRHVGETMHENFANGEFIVAMFQNRDLLKEIYNELCALEELGYIER